MQRSDETMKAGLQMLEERMRPLFDAEASKQIELAQQPWNEALNALDDYQEVVRILKDLSSQVLPYLIKGHEISPVHHIAYVVKFMALITTSEESKGGLSREDVKCGILAALLHDIGIGDCVLGKITEKMIENTPPEARQKLRKDGIAARLKHMKKGVQISRCLLERYHKDHPKALEKEDRDDIEIILDIVRTHDNCKIPMMEESVKKKWLLSPDKSTRSAKKKASDWLKQCHWEADALWMLTPAGVLVDLERERVEVTPDNRKKRLAFNFRLHQDIVELYKKAYGDGIDKFRFKGGTLYRTEEGTVLATQLKLQGGVP